MHRSAAGNAGCGLFHRQGHDKPGKLLLVLAGCLVLFGGMELLSRGGDPAGEITAVMFLGWLGLLGTIGALASLLSRAVKARYLKSQEQEEKIQL